MFLISYLFLCKKLPQNLVTLNNKHLPFHSGSGVQEGLSSVVLANSFSWGCSQDVGLGLHSSEGLSGAGGPASQVAHSHDWDVGADCWETSVSFHKELSIGLLECPQDPAAAPEWVIQEHVRWRLQRLLWSIFELQYSKGYTKLRFYSIAAAGYKGEAWAQSQNTWVHSLGSIYWVQTMSLTQRTKD